MHVLHHITMLLYYFTMIYVSVYRCVYRNTIYTQHVCVHTYYMYIYIHIHVVTHISKYRYDL